MSPPAPPHYHLRYRPEVDGLRAVAVVPVILYHMGVSAFGGGFVGVDVFFVISGYLITSIITGDVALGRFTIVGFYERRARRILPALLFVLLVCTPIAWFVMLPFELLDYMRSLAAVSVFASNVFFMLTSSYFDVAADEKPLLHTWSLGVEEQYYVLFPLLIMLLWRFGRARLAWLIAGIAAASLALSEVGWRSAPDATFFLLHTRAWELLIGSLLSLASFHRPIHERVPPAAREAFALLGLALIAASVFLYAETTPFPSVYALAPTVGTALVLAFAWTGTRTARLLSARSVVFIGLISYSLYLWHQPLFAFARLAGAEAGSAVFPALALAAVALAYLSWRFVEKPFRDRARVTRRQVFTVAAGGSALFLSVGVAGHVTRGFRSIKYASVPAGSRRVLNVEPERRGAWRYTEMPESRSPFRSTGKTRVLIIGDSHSKDVYNAILLTPALSETIEVRRLSLAGRCVVQAGGSVARPDAECARQLAELRAQAALVQAADHVLLNVRWKRDAPEAVGAFLRSLGELGRNVVIVGNTAEFGNPLRSAMHALARRTADSATRVEFAATRRRALDALNEQLGRAAAQAGRPFLDRAQLNCDGGFRACDLFAPDGALLYYDYGHWTIAGARFFGARMVERGWLRPALDRAR